MSGSRAWTLAVVCAATAVLLIDVTAVSVALPAIEHDLGADLDELQWVVDAYALMLAATLLTAGALADRHGRRRVFVAGLAVFALASALCAAAWSPLALDLARGLQGLGAAGMFATSLALLASVFASDERGVALGVWGAVSGAALAAGPLAGGALVDGLGWQWIFLANLPIAAALAGATLARVPESRDSGAAAIDLPGMATFAAALLCLTLGLIRGNAEGWGSPAIVASLGGGALLLALFAAIELRRPHPMLDLRLFRIPAFAGTAAVAFAQSAAIYPMLLFLALWFQDVLGYSPLESGLRVLPMTLALFAVAPLAGRLTGRVALRWLLALGLALLTVALLMMRGLHAGSDWDALVPGFLVAGAGIGVISPALAAAMIGVLPVERSGLASGINNTFRQVGIAVGIAGLGAIFEHRVAAEGGYGPAARGAVAEGLNEIFLVAALVAAVGIAACALIRPRDFAR